MKLSGWASDTPSKLSSRKASSKSIGCISLAANCDCEMLETKCADFKVKGLTNIMENSKPIDVAPSPGAARTMNQLPFIDIEAAFASGDDFNAFVESVHEQGPFARSDRGLEVLGYKESVAMLRDSRLEYDHGALMDAVNFPEGPAKEYKKGKLISHGRGKYRTRVRQALTRTIGASVIEEQRPMIRQLVKDILQKIDPDKKSEMLRDFSFLVPSSLFCLWFGSPLEDAPWVAKISDRLLKIFTFDPKYTPDIVAAYDELLPYVQNRIDEAMEAPKENLLGNFIAEYKAGNFNETELFQTVAMFNEASTDNTSHGIATAIGELMGDQKRWQQIVDNPDLIPAAINESMRLSGRINAVGRHAIEDLEYEGVLIPKGTAVYIVVPAAHRDPRVYDDPLRYDPTRKDIRNILDFGGGVYTCLGKFVALIEIQEVIAELARTYPNARVKRFSINSNSHVNEVAELEVELNGG